MDNCDLHHEALRKSSVELQSKLNINNTIISHLQQENLLTDDEIDTLTNSNKCRGDKVQYLISILPTKGSNWWGKFVKILRNTTAGTAHNEVADKLEQELDNLEIGKYHIAGYSLRVLF